MNKSLINAVKQHYNICNILESTSISITFFESFYDLFKGNFIFALLAEDGVIEVYNNQGILVDVIKNKIMGEQEDVKN